MKEKRERNDFIVYLHETYGETFFKIGKRYKISEGRVRLIYRREKEKKKKLARRLQMMEAKTTQGGDEDVS